MTVYVTPHAGVRIEMIILIPPPRSPRSPPTRGCELKYVLGGSARLQTQVTPHAGVRIEIGWASTA